MSTLIHFFGLEYDDTIIDDETGEFRCDVYRFIFKIGRTMIGCSADVKYFFNNDGTRGYFVDAVYFDEDEDERMLKIYDKHFPNIIYIEDMVQRLRGVCKHCVRLMLTEEKTKYSFNIV